MQTTTNTANRDWLADLLGDQNMNNHSNEWVFARVNAITHQGAGIFGFAPGPSQSDVLGRRGAIFIAGILCLGVSSEELSTKIGNNF